jgi:hypothetical protein
MAEHNSPNHVSCIALRELSTRLALSLRGSLQTNGLNQIVVTENEKRNDRLSLSIIPETENNSRCSLLLEGRNLKEKMLRYKIGYENIEHLYVTWDTPQLVTFCFSENGRYTLLNVHADTTIYTMDGKDRRQDNNASEENLNQRRKFYHVGAA